MRKIVLLFVILGFSSTSAFSGSSNANGRPVKLTKAEFIKNVMNYEENKEWKYEGELPCIVDFYADWCPPCRQVSPVLDELAKEYAGKIIIYKVDIDVEKDLAKAFKVKSIPTFLWIPKSGEFEVSSGIGKTPEKTKQEFKKMINEILLVK